MKSNFLEIPTDCPTRERAGWTGDAQIFISHQQLSSWILHAFFRKWLKDLSLDQFPDGKVSNLVPNPYRLIKGGVGQHNELDGWCRWLGRCGSYHPVGFFIGLLAISSCSRANMKV